MLLIVIGLAGLGLILGSFINALVWRLHELEELQTKTGKKAEKERQSLSITRGRSMCTHCHHVLLAKDLVPVFSWLWLRGKCRYCHKKIEDNPLIEVCTSLLFVISYAVWPFDLHGWGLVQFVFWLPILVGFVALAVYDLRWYILPDKIVFPLVTLAAIEVVFHITIFGGGIEALLAALWGVIIASGLFYVLFQVSNGEWIGGGDVKLGIVLGLLLGGPLMSLMLLFIASLIGSLISIPLMIIGKAGRKTLIPFGPFLITAAISLELFGSHISNWLNTIAR
jgi:prepilin signal peptidase PulO-like enzyme (type II secretory pathway)